MTPSEKQELLDAIARLEARPTHREFVIAVLAVASAGVAMAVAALMVI